MPQLIIEQPNTPPMTIPIADQKVTLGRSEENDVVLTAEEVSRQHAYLSRRGSQSILTDLKSLNGTYVNRQRVSERILKHMDEIWFGSKCRILFRDDTSYGALELPESGEAPCSDSKLEKSIDGIREEMDRVGMNMTLIGMRTPVPDTTLQMATPPPVLSPDDIIRMGRAYRRLSALHKANQVITSDFDLQTRLSKMLDTIMEVLQASRGFVLLRNENNQALHVMVARQMGRELGASSPSMGIAGRAAIDGEPVLMSDSTSDQEFGMRESIIVNQIRSAMCVPLKVENRILGSIYVDSDNPAITFLEEDLELFASLASQTAMAVENVRLHDRFIETEKRRENLARFLPGALVEKLMTESEDLTLGGLKTYVTTMFCDIRGSSQIAERLSPQELVTLLNEHFTAMTEILFNYEGTLDKYIGDEIMAIFGAPISVGDEEYRSVCAALEMQERNKELNALRRSENRPELHFGIGIDSGDVIAGYIGSPKRMDFTVVGDRVNTAKRFCDMAGPGKTVVGEHTWNAIKDRVESVAMGNFTLKGKEQTVYAYEILSLKKA
ncbi:MAG: FHA domain-containing protein [Candidatus Hydrogenedentes bacterium]|nr:FHA domain-containing protein [Candidatus Hydrogenedentota bacterium]